MKAQEQKKPDLKTRWLPNTFPASSRQRESQLR
jgi:hypothetical protein